MFRIIFLALLSLAVFQFYSSHIAADNNSIYTATSESGVRVLSDIGGPGFDVRQLSVHGQLTVVEFYVSWCPACKRLNDKYPQMLKYRPDLAIRRVQMIDNWNIPWAKRQYGLDIHGTPHIIVLDSNGQILAEDQQKSNAGSKYLYKLVNDEIKRQHNS